MSTTSVPPAIFGVPIAATLPAEPAPATATATAAAQETAPAAPDTASLAATAPLSSAAVAAAAAAPSPASELSLADAGTSTSTSTSTISTISTASAVATTTTTTEVVPILTATTTTSATITTTTTTTTTTTRAAATSTTTSTTRRPNAVAPVAPVITSPPTDLSASTNPSLSSASSDGLSTGAIAGIVISSVVVFVGLVALCLFLCFKHQRGGRNRTDYAAGKVAKKRELIDAELESGVLLQNNNAGGGGDGTGLNARSDSDNWREGLARQSEFLVSRGVSTTGANNTAAAEDSYLLQTIESGGRSPANTLSSPPTVTVRRNLSIKSNTTITRERAMVSQSIYSAVSPAAPSAVDENAGGNTDTLDDDVKPPGLPSNHPAVLFAHNLLYATTNPRDSMLAHPVAESETNSASPYVKASMARISQKLKRLSQHEVDLWWQNYYARAPEKAELAYRNSLINVSPPSGTDPSDLAADFETPGVGTIPRSIAGTDTSGANSGVSATESVGVTAAAILTAKPAEPILQTQKTVAVSQQQPTPPGLPSANPAALFQLHSLYVSDPRLSRVASITSMSTLGHNNGVGSNNSGTMNSSTNATDSTIISPSSPSPYIQASLSRTFHQRTVAAVAPVTEQEEEQQQQVDLWWHDLFVRDPSLAEARYKSMIQEKEEVTARDLLFTSGEAAVKIQEAKNNTKRAAGSITSGASGLSRKASGGTLSLPRVNGGSGVKLEDLEERWEAKDSVVGKGDREDDDAGSVESVITATTTASFLELERMDSTRMEEEVLKVWADQQTFSSSADEEVEEIPPVVVLTSVVTPPVVVSIPRSFKTVSFSAVDDVVEFPVDQESSSLNVVEESCEIVEVAPVESLTTGMYEAQPLKPESVTYPDVVGQMYHVKPFYGKTEEFTATDVDSSFGASANANLQLNERTDVEEHGSTTPESGEDSSLIVATLESDASLLLSKSSEVVQVGVLNSNVNESQSTESTLVRKPSKIVALETETPPDSSAESTDLEVEVEVGAAEAKSKKKKSKKSAKKRK